MKILGISHPYSCNVAAALPVAVNVDSTARMQGVTRSANPRDYRLIQEFKRLTGRGALLDTSFIDAEEPLVCSLRGALRTLFATGLDALVRGSFLVRKQAQAASGATETP